uniref:Uncharacterized protein n=1 Tax=Cyprinus carpio TaxID=7962 RepID=A0A8C2IXL0_CYPCA
MGRPFPTPWVKGRSGFTSLGDLEVIQEDYVTSLIEKLNSICADVSLCLPLPSEHPTHSFVPGQSVLIKSLKPTKVGEPRYLGPATVIAVTRTGVLTDYQPQWIHASRLKYYSTGEEEETSLEQQPNLQHIILQRVFPNRTTFWLFTIQYRVFDV